MNVLMKRWLSLITAVSVITVMCFSGIGTAKVYAADNSVVESPAVIITRTGVVGGNEYSADNIDKEKVYTMADLKEMAAKDQDESKAIDNEYLYSAYNTWDNSSIYRAKGVRAAAVFAEAGVADSALAENKVTIAAEDGYGVSFDPSREEPGTKDDARHTNAYLNQRYYFPNITKENEEEGKIAVPAIFAWADKGDKGSISVPDSTGMEDYKHDYVRFITGQLSAKDYNNPLWNGESKYMLVTVGEELPDVININGKDYNRAEMLAMDSMTAPYTYSGKGGDVTESAKGVPLANFLESYSDDTVVEFAAEDGYPVNPLTKAQILDGNYILAYEKGESADTMESILETDKGGQGLKGYFTLYGDGAKPAKLINKVTVKASEEPEQPTEPEVPAITAPAAPAAAAAAKVNYNTVKVSWSKVADADGYKVYRYSKAAGKYSVVKTITGAKTTSCTDTGLKTGTTYTYKVKAYKKDGEKTLLSKTYSPAKSIRLTLNKPSISKITKGKGYASVKWTKTAGANGYKVYRAASKSGKYTCIKTVTKGTTVTYKNTKLKKGKKYYYKVRAYRTVDGKKVYSAYSAIKYITAK